MMVRRCANSKVIDCKVIRHEQAVDQHRLIIADFRLRKVEIRTKRHLAQCEGFVFRGSV